MKYLKNFNESKIANAIQKNIDVYFAGDLRRKSIAVRNISDLTGNSREIVKNVLDTSDIETSMQSLMEN